MYYNKIDEIVSRWYNFVNIFKGIGINLQMR